MEELILKELLEILGGALPGWRLFTETVRQGAEYPALFVKLESCEAKREMANRYAVSGEFSLEFLGEGDVFPAAEAVGAVREAMAGGDFALESAELRPDGSASARAKAKMGAFLSEEEEPVRMGKLGFTIRLGEESKKGEI